MCSAEGLGILGERGKYAADPYGYGKEGKPVTRAELDASLAKKFEEEFPGEAQPKGMTKKEEAAFMRKSFPNSKRIQEKYK
jgi:hypothetical protein